ncbi:LysR family transcriptional regulator [Mycolicibacterium brumae]|uniref:Probable hydrogen peroxide-inducible genes activator n=1 Tax=Mycolicibacterium brumae TaxID=85968 RepID=A0A2G5PDI1_9MYCO|nr:LysR family transcriptional regulator [Mycolicibacterium brumae]MCV7191742.1 LysR family transcriptional regulator [Mycolicibacterium brumae]PIB76391.1 LysR family transcriptional regulator [Mycolicibacterium brumae]UWW07047.1 LysR family transcriptional regulator [Mycolicibacterium brumae]
MADLRRLRQFTAVAETGSFTAAAAGLHLSQQALSASVRQLEAELGVTLFSRAGRRIALTAAGRALLAESRPLLAAAETVGQRVRSAGVQTREWVVGHSPAISGSEAYTLLEPAITAFPELSVTFRQLYPDGLAAGVLDGTLDLGLRRGVATGDELAGAVVGYHRVRAAFPAAHRLAASPSVTLPDLAGEPLALWAPPGASYFSDFLMAACRRCGFEPDYVVSRVQGAAMVTAPLTTGAAALVTAEPGPAVDGRVVVVELEPALLLPVQALWQRHTMSDIRDALLQGP